MIVNSRRYAHHSGHTDVTINPEKGFITIGNDGDVRFWDSVNDVDPRSERHNGANAANCLSAIKDNKIVIGTDRLSVKIYTLPSLEESEILTGFSAPCTSAVFISNTNRVALSSADMTIKIINLNKNEPVTLMGHQGPVFNLSCDPLGQFLASSSGDKTVRIWNIMEEQCNKVIDNVVERCNDYFESRSLCKTSWTKNGKYLIIPSNAKIFVVSRLSWQTVTSLEDPAVTTFYTCVALSSNENILIAGSKSGYLSAWNMNNYKLICGIELKKYTPISTILFVNKDEVIITDHDGFISSVTIDSTIESKEVPAVSTITSSVVPENNFDADSEFDDYLNNFEEPKFTDEVKETVDDDDKTSVTGSEISEVNIKTTIEIQETFQPGSTPTCLENFFLAFNCVGRIIADSKTINVMFFGEQTDLLFRNQDFEYGALSNTAIALASEAVIDDKNSCICVKVLQDRSDKEFTWTEDLEEGENILALSCGAYFIAAFTNLNLLRIYSLYGLKREAISVPGPILTMCASYDKLMIISHNAPSAGGSQFLSAYIYEISRTSFRAIHHETLPTTPNAKIKWAGFTDELLPCVYDSQKLLRVRLPHHGWTPYKIITKMANVFMIGCNLQTLDAMGVACAAAHPLTTVDNYNTFEIRSLLAKPETEKAKGELAMEKCRHLELLIQNSFVDDTTINKEEREKLNYDIMNLTKVARRENFLEDMYLLLSDGFRTKIERLLHALGMEEQVEKYREIYTELTSKSNYENEESSDEEEQENGEIVLKPLTTKQIKIKKQENSQRSFSTPVESSYDSNTDLTIKSKRNTSSPAPPVSIDDEDIEMSNVITKPTRPSNPFSTANSQDNLKSVFKRQNSKPAIVDEKDLQENNKKRKAENDENTGSGEVKRQSKLEKFIFKKKE